VKTRLGFYPYPVPLPPPPTATLQVRVQITKKRGKGGSPGKGIRKKARLRTPEQAEKGRRPVRGASRR
jgi:hypothetical protein